MEKVFDLKVLSFIIPAYNSQQFLDKCICSMLSLPVLEKLEIIVVNDGSKDETAETAKKYCLQYPDTVRLINQENKGHGGALNTGCAAATGKYLKVIDADDWVLTENLPDYIAMLENCQSDVVLTHHHTVDISSGEIKGWKAYPRQYGEAVDMETVMGSWDCYERSLTFHGITYRTDFYQAIGYRLAEHVFYEDHEYATYPCCYAKSITPLDLFVYEYRIGDVNQSVSQANQLARVGHMEKVVDCMTASMGKLEDGAGKRYAARKLHDVFLSYLKTVLMVQPDRKSGRSSAAQRLQLLRQDAPLTYSMVLRKYEAFLLLNRLHISLSTWNKLLDSKIYKKLRNKHSFE